MSYKVLARKWRPQHFRDMIGQEAVLRALGNALDTNRLHHAYLFTGMRGVGKTTIARILAKCLNCETNGISSSPCGSCSVCQDIEQGRFLDLIEVDAASRTKVDETRELLENVPYAPASGRYKVYLIDEVHMFSTHSFNALLKTLEEPPAHVKFVLATTDPQKVPVTVLSRCLQFNLKRLPAGRLTDYLAHILDEEAIEHERAALELIARASEGSVRDSLSLVEQAAAYGEGAVRQTDVESMLGRVSTDRLLMLIEHLVNTDTASLFQSVEALADYAPDYQELLGELLSLMHRVALLQQVPDAVDSASAGHDRLQSLAGRVAPDALQLFYQIGLHARRDMPFAPDPREAFDMALLRMQIFQPQGVTSSPDHPATSLASPTDVAASAMPSPGAGEARSDSGGSATAPAGTPTRAPASASAPAPEPTAVRPAAPVPARSPVSASESSPSVTSPDAQAQAAAVEEQTRATAESSSANDASTRPAGSSVPMALTAEIWPETVTRLGLSGMPRQLAAHSCLKAHSTGTVCLLLEADSEHLNTPRFKARLEKALSEYIGETTTLDIEVVSGETLDATPARLQALSEQEELEAARQAIEQDPNVQRLIASVDGTVDPKSVRPLKPVGPQESS